MRPLHRLGPGHHRREIDKLAVIFRLGLGPDRLHRLDLLAHPLEARRIDRAVILHLVLVPAAADAEQKAASRHLVERGDRLRQLHRVALDHQTDAGAELERGGRGGRGAQAHERVHRVVILLRQLAAGREGGLARQRDVRVLGRPDRLKAARLQGPAELGRRHRIIGEEHRRADIHVPSPENLVEQEVTFRRRGRHATTGRAGRRVVRHTRAKPVLCTFRAAGTSTSTRSETG